MRRWYLILFLILGACGITLAAFASDSCLFHAKSAGCKGGYGEQKLVSSTHSFKESFDGEVILEEASDMQGSSHNDWWVNSGAFLYIEDGIGKTLSGQLPSSSPWQASYAAYNPDSTDGGIHPQNIFRLLTRSKWQNADQQVYFRITNLHLSESANRNESNGVLLFHRYLGNDTLYYAGIRVDGVVVIKKKVNNVYYTLGGAEFFTTGPYNREENPNVIPLNMWIGIRSVVRNNPDNSVNIQVYVDPNRSGKWILALETTDVPMRYDTAPITDSGFAGIRTDFMDVEFDDYEIHEIAI